jgi:hypothetical protein
VITANGMSSIGVFLRSHLGHFITGAFTILATVIIVWDNHSGRNHAASNFDTKIDGIYTKINNKIDSVYTKIDNKIDGVHTKIDDLKADFTRLEGKSIHPWRWRISTCKEMLETRNLAGLRQASLFVLIILHSL